MAQHPLLVKAAQHTAQARAINDEFEGKEMPAEAAHQMEGHLKKAGEFRRAVERERQLQDNESWLSEPDYKHDGGASEGGQRLGGTDAGEFLLESERKDKTMKSFLGYVRKGEAGIAPEVKADLVEDASGELLVPQDYAGTIFKDVPREAVIRGLAFIRPTTRNRVDIGSLTVGSAGWGKLELGDVAPDGMGAPDKDEIKVWDLNALVKIGVDELEDTDDNLEALIRSQLALKIAEIEDDAFANGAGDASKQPSGMAGAATNTVAAAAGQVVSTDELKSLKYAVASQYRRNGVYLAHSEVEEQVALLKDSEGRYLLQQNAALEEPPTLFGKRFFTVDGLPAPGTTADAGAGTDRSCLFGDVRQAYVIADRRRLTVTRLVERFAEEGKIGLLFTHRVGGGTIRGNALAAYLL